MSHLRNILNEKMFKEKCTGEDYTFVLTFKNWLLHCLTFSHHTVKGKLLYRESGYKEANLSPTRWELNTSSRTYCSRGRPICVCYLEDIQWNWRKNYLLHAEVSKYHLHRRLMENLHYTTLVWCSNWNIPYTCNQTFSLTWKNYQLLTLDAWREMHATDSWTANDRMTLFEWP